MAVISTNGQHPGRLSSPALVGRDGELARLVELVDSPPAIAIVEGEAGMGKSRLVRELARVPGLGPRRVLVGHCHQLREPFPLGPLIEALRHVGDLPARLRLSGVVGSLRPLLPELARSLPRRPRPLGDPRAERHRVFRGLRELLGALGPAICVVEDLHWADEGTLEFLSFLMSEQPAELSLVLTNRAEEFERSCALAALVARAPERTSQGIVELAGLGPGEVRALASQIAGNGEVSPEFAAQLHECTAGLPFAIEEVIGLLGRRGTLELVNGREGQGLLERLEVPPAVRQSVLDRMQLLTPDARRIADAAAVLAQPADSELIVGVAGLPRARGERALAKARACALIEEERGGRFGYRHPLAAQAVYERLPGPARRRLHLRAGRALERAHEPRPFARIAHHLKAAGCSRWVTHAEAAARLASASGDDSQAARLLEDALAAPGLPRATRVRLAIALGDVAVYSLTPAGATAGLQRIIEEEEMPAVARGQLRCSLARVLGQAGDSAGCRRELVRAVGELRRRPDLAAPAMINLAQPWWSTQGDLDDHFAWLRRARKTAERQCDLATRIAVAAQGAVILLSLGDPAAWPAADEIPRPAGLPQEAFPLLWGYHGLAVTSLALGHHLRAASFLAEADRIQAEWRHPWWELQLASVHASMDWTSGRWHGLEGRLRTLLEDTAPVLSLWASNRFTLDALLLARGKLDDAQRGLASALEIAQAAGRPSLVGLAGRLARLHLDRGNVEAARELALLGLDTVRAKGVWVWARPVAPEATDALIACGELASARELVDELAAGLQGRDAPATTAALDWCRGAVAEADGRHGTAVRLLARAEARWRHLCNPYEAARARERAARSALARSDAHANDLLQGALEAFRELGAAHDARRVHVELEARGARRRGRRGYGSSLSPREMEVVRLAQTGRTNREIAEELFISPRTVADHVASAISKLGVASKRSLITASIEPEQANIP